jgi:transposase
MSSSTIGRPRAVTDEQIAVILQWHARKSQLGSVRQLARDLGLSVSAVYTVIQRRGEYKQACPSTKRQAKPVSKG